MLWEVGRVLLWSQADWGSKPVAATDLLDDLGQGTHLSESQFLYVHQEHKSLIMWTVWINVCRAAAQSPDLFLTL